MTSIGQVNRAKRAFVAALAALVLSGFPAPGPGAATAAAAPGVTIGMPVDGGAAVTGESVALAGSARDAIDGDLSAALAW
jgi:hypothetical protein